MVTIKRGRWSVVGSFLAVPVLVFAVAGFGSGDREPAASRPGAPVSDVRLAIHCGTGALDRSQAPPELAERYDAMFRKALGAGYDVLENGGRAVDAVQAAVVVMEDDPLCNAGRGAVFNENAQHQLDASIMDGSDLDVGAVAAVENVKNPIKAARLVMDETPHVLLAAEGADDFAARRGLDMVTQDYYWTRKSWEALMEAKRGENHDQPHGTVGAVAVDAHGELAAATSTGGLTNKMVGRVGDSPVPGAGTYADSEVVAVSATGTGEAFLRTNAAREVAIQMRYRGLNVADGARAALDRVARFGEGAVIALSPEGDFAAPRTGSIKHAWITSSGHIETRVYEE